MDEDEKHTTWPNDPALYYGVRVGHEALTAVEALLDVLRDRGLIAQEEIDTIKASAKDSYLEAQIASRRVKNLDDWQ